MITTSSSASQHPKEAPEPPSARPAPWMPLEGLAHLWGMYGQVVSHAEAFQAVSAAFAALAEEREALSLFNGLSQRHQRITASNALDAPLHLATRHQSIIARLTQAASHWFDAACALFAEMHAPLTGAEEAVPAGLDLDTLIGYTLAQRERVWAIAHALLLEQIRPYQSQWAEQGMPEVFPPTAPADPDEGGRPQ
jgi:hypothetical protein